VAVKDLSFRLNAGETLAIVGESGSGKSLTALALMGLLPKTATLKGELLLHTNNAVFPLRENTPDAWQALRGKAIGMVFQEPMSALNPVMKIGKQLAESILVHEQISRTDAKKKAIGWLAKVQLPTPEKLYDRYPHELSGGQKQRVMIAMAMCHHPAVLIADEPTTALDVTVQQEVITLMRGLQQEYGTSLIFITHDLALAAQIATNVLVMYRGEMMEYGAAEKVLHNPEHPYTKALLACRPSANKKGERLPVVADFWNSETGEVAVQSQPQHEAIISNQDRKEIILKAEDVYIWFPQERNFLGKTLQYFKAVNGVSFELYKGETLGLVGESGCGKSTLSKSLMGLVPVKEGHVFFNGKDLAHLDHAGWTMVRRQMQMVFQDPFASLNPRLTVGDIISEPMLAHGLVTQKQVKEATYKLLDLVQLSPGAYHLYPHQFSGGQRQRIGIARALGLQPQVLICDESVSALDVSIQAQILNLLKDLQQQLQLTYLFISHDLSVINYMSDRIMVMQQGKLVEVNTAEAVMQHPSDPYTQKLIAAMPEFS
jgi:peptide/nickel transport system ATP-binding protein